MGKPCLIFDRGSPAPAGIDPIPEKRPHVSPRFPRTRGDRPYGVEMYGDRQVVPPHPRG